MFSGIGLLRDEKGKTVFRTERGPLKEVLDRIEERANYGDTASGRYLTDEFAKEPFGWDFVETEEQLDAALDGVREECARLIGAGKKVIVQ